MMFGSRPRQREAAFSFSPIGTLDKITLGHEASDKLLQPVFTAIKGLCPRNMGIDSYDFDSDFDGNPGSRYR